MIIDIKVDHLKIVQEILKKYLPGKKILVFGSRAKGTAKNTSDLDLCVMDNQPLPFNLLAHLRDAFSESDLPYQVDIVDWASLDHAFQAIVQKNGLIIVDEHQDQ